VDKSTRQQVEDKILQIHQLRVEGKSNQYIMQSLGISERNYYKTYVPALNKKWAKLWGDKKDTELFTYAQEFKERMLDAFDNVRRQARRENANPIWSQLERDYGMLLFEFERDGIIARAKLRQLERKTPQDNESRSERGTIILQEHPADRQPDQGDGSDKQ
jgi:hypothetical protein